MPKVMEINSAGCSAELADELFRDQRDKIYRETDRLFAWLMLFQWVAGMAAAAFVTPLTWHGQTSAIHIHVWAAIFLGGAITIFPIWMTRAFPGAAATRYVIAVAQMLMSALFISLSGGRIETHFHVFGSLAVLSFYRDWRVLIPATLVVAADHFLRGIYWPYSVYGVLNASAMRSLEHAGWVVFEEVFLIISCLRSVREMHVIASRTAEIQTFNRSLEQRVAERTARLETAISEQKCAGELLRSSEQRYRSLFQNNPNPMWVYDRETLSFLAVNDAAVAHYGYSQAEFQGMSITDIRPAEDVAALIDDVSHTAKA